MRDIFKLLTAFLVIALGFTSCNTDQESDLYTNSANGALFMNASLASVTVSPSDPTFTVDLIRPNGNGELSGTIAMTATVDDKALEGCTISGFTFAAGETMTKASINVAPLKIGKKLKITLTLGSEKPLSGSNTLTVTVNKDYEWVSLGTGTFADILAFTEKPYNVEILKAEGFDRYRALKPYVEGLKNDDGQWGNAVSTTSCDYIEFWLEDGIVYYNSFYIGINYEGSSANKVYAYHPSEFTGMSSANNIQLNDKTFQLAPYYYIEPLEGGFDYTGKGGSILITLP